MDAEWPQHFRPEVVQHAFGGGRLSAYCISLEAWRRGLTVTFTDPAMRRYTISDGTRTIQFSDSRPETLTKSSDYSKLMRKSETIAQLKASGIPTPRSIPFDARKTDLDAIERLGERVGYPLVIKPEAGSMGQGVFTGLRTTEDLRRTYSHVLESGRAGQMVIESHHEGSDHRILVIGDRVVAATRRVPTHVIGDGQSSVKDLVNAKNAVRKQNPFLSSGLIKIDYEATSLLTEQGLDTASVPADGQLVRLSHMANGSAGGDIVDVTEELPTEVLDAAIGAVRAFDNIHISGVDLIYEAPEDADGATGSYVIIELNSRPHIATNMFPSAGTGRDVPRHFMDYFFPGSRRAELPGDDSIVYHYPSVQTVQKSRVAKELTLTALPAEHYPARRFVHLRTGDEFVNLPRIRRERLDSSAAKLGIVGDVVQPEREVVHATLGATSMESLDEFVSVLTDALRGSVVESSPWGGLLTTGFRLARPILGKRRT